MLKSEFSHGYYDRPSLLGTQPQQPQIPDHLKCGEVYTWLCAGELYAVECKLCEDHPLCPLSEFPQHMEIWHTDWETDEHQFEGDNLYLSLTDIEDSQNDPGNYNNDHAFPHTTEGSGLLDTEDQVHSERVLRSHEEQEEILEPFEQVLIEQDLTVDTTTQISEDVHEDEYFKDINEQQVAKAGEYRNKENKRQQKQTLALTNKDQRKGLNEITECESRSRQLTETKESNREINFKPANVLRSKQKALKKHQIKKKNYRQVWKKSENLKRNLKNSQPSDGTAQETKGNGTNDTDATETRKVFRKTGVVQKSCKIRKIKKALNKIIKDLSDLRETDETGSETSDIDNQNKYQNVFYIKSYKTKSSGLKQNSISENEIEKSTIETATSEMERETLECKTKHTNESDSANIRKHIIKTSLKTNKNILPKLKRYTKSKSLRKINVKKLSKIKTKHKNKKQIASKQNAKITESEISKEHSDNVTDRIKSETQISVTGKECHGNKTERSEKSEDKIEMNENETGLKENLSELSAIETETSESETGLNGNETTFNEIKLELNDNVTESKDNKTQLFEKEFQTKQSEHKKDTNGIETNEFLKKLHKNKLKPISNKGATKLKTDRAEKLCVSDKGTSENETNRLNVLQKSFSLNAKSVGYLTRKRAKNLNRNKAESNENETMTKSGPTEQYANIKEINESSPLVNDKQAKHYVREKQTNGKNYTKNSISLEDLSNTKAGKCVKRNLRGNLNKNKAEIEERETLLNNIKNQICLSVNETNEIETNNTNFLKRLKQSKNLRKKVKHFLNKSSIKLLKENEVGTSESETLLDENMNGTNEDETMVSDNKAESLKESNKSEIELKSTSNIDGTVGIETSQSNFFAVLQKSMAVRKKAEKFLNRKCKRNSKTKKQHMMEQYEVEDKVEDIKKFSKSNLKETCNIVPYKMKTTRKSLRNSSCTVEINKCELKSGGTNEIETANEHPTDIQWRTVKPDLNNCQKDECANFNFRERSEDKQEINELKRRLRSDETETHCAVDPFRSNKIKTRLHIEESLRKNTKKETLYEIVEEKTCKDVLSANLGSKLSDSSVFQKSSKLSVLCRNPEKNKIEDDANEAPVEKNIRDKIIQANPSDEEGAQNCESKLSQNLIEKEYKGEIAKQTLATQLFVNESEENSKNCAITEQEYHEANSYPSRNSSKRPIPEPSSPLSPNTEEEHFEFYEPKEKLNKQHISYLIQLYHEHPRLWDQSHPDFCEPQVCRKSWQKITDQWNKYCKRKFTIAEVRIRICTLCQRFVQERDRLVLEGELDEYAKFPYYEEMKFLEQQKSLQKRRELYEQQNEKIVEIYQHFPVLWHVGYYKSRQAKERASAFESISKVLKLFGLHLSSLGVQKRIRSLRKCYRLEKIRHLHAQVEHTRFDSEFRHYARMQFLDKHIDPYVCRVCGKIFQQLQGLREHLENENHGNILQQESDTEYGLDKERGDGRTTNTDLDVESAQAKAIDHVESFTESENSSDILQRFTPFSSTPIPTLEDQLHMFPLNTPNDPIINSLRFEDQLIEEIMENVANNDAFSQQGLDQFINSVTSCEHLPNENCLLEENFGSSFLHTENSFVVQHPDIVTDQTSCILSPLMNEENLLPANFCKENVIVEHPDIVTVQEPANESLEDEDQPLKSDFVGESPVKATNVLLDIEKDVNLNCLGPHANVEESITEQNVSEKLSLTASLVVNVQCADYSLDLKLNSEPSLEPSSSPNDSENEYHSSGDNSITPLPDDLIHKMVEFYRKYPQLWNPNHLDFNSRTLRRQAWVTLATEFNAVAGKQLSWRTLHRKLTDYAKYYKKLITEQENYESLENKWNFYEDFKFMDDVIDVNTELQRSVHHRDNNFKIIATYKCFPQLWDIKHAEFNKRSTKQRNIELMCNRLQEENNLQLTTERLKNRLIELRTQYRTAKKQRLKCLKNRQEFSASEFEFYEALSFLDDHIDPFVCNKCNMEFKKLTDYNQHMKKEHTQKRSITLPTAEPGMENVCHICGIKMTTRSNLVHHIKRHEGIRNYACSMCPKKFYASHSLKVHIRSHTKECPYTCEKCGISFVSSSKLNQHVKRHLNRKDFECAYCPKAFFTAFEKDRHERRHLNIRDKVCPICGKTFVAGSSYYAHLMLHNDTKRFECDKCDMKFAQYAGLYKHKKRHHT